MIRALIAGETAAAEALLAARVPGEWPGLSDVFRTRLAQLGSAPENEPWLIRAIILEREEKNGDGAPVLDAGKAAEFYRRTVEAVGSALEEVFAGWEDLRR